MVIKKRNKANQLYQLYSIHQHCKRGTFVRLVLKWKQLSWLALCLCDENTMTKVTWGRKGVFALYHWGRARQEFQAETKKQEQKQRPQRNATLLLFIHSPGSFPMDDTAHNGLYPATSITNQENALHTQPQASLMEIVPQMKFSFPKLTLDYVSLRAKANYDRNYGDLHENVSLRLIHLNAWSPVGGSV